MGACASRAVASRADDDEGNATATTANDGSVEDGASEFDPMDLAKREADPPSRRVKRKPSRELHPTIARALKSKSETVRRSAQFLIDQERCDSESERTLERMRDLPAQLAAVRGDEEWRGKTKRDAPRGVVAVSHAFGAAIREQDFEWATREEIESLFAPTVDYLNVHGDFFQGRDAVCESLNESVRRMSSRLRLSSTRGDARTLGYVQMDVRGPTYKGRGADIREWSEWHIEYSFKILLLKIKIREIYLVDDETDLIRHLCRQRVH